jgi:multiple sugar transport system substrate-binding protein
VRRRSAALAGLAGLLLAGGCDGDSGTSTLRLWALGREGELVQELTRDFETENPGVRVEVQQIPWSAAHEKLLTAYVGRSTPDVAQLGNTWVAEFVALRALEPLDERVRGSSTVDAADYFAGIWDTNVVDGTLWGVPWYVDTRVLFYRKDLLARAGWSDPPSTWDGWRRAMEAVKANEGADRYGVFLPVNEWTQIVILGLQAGSTLLAEEGTRGAFREPAFRRAFEWYLGLYRDGLAPAVGNNDIANLYQEFARGTFAMYVTGPWNLGEFRRRLPDELQNSWATATLPGPDQSTPGVSLAGGSSLVMFRGTRQPDLAWKLVEFLSRPEQQVRFYRMSGDLPARQRAWADSALAGDAQAMAFREQLERAVPMPKVPEWEQIATAVLERSDQAIRGGVPAEQALALLDGDAERILEKRRWLLQRRGAGPVGEAR